MKTLLEAFRATGIAQSSRRWSERRDKQSVMFSSAGHLRAVAAGPGWLRQPARAGPGSTWPGCVEPGFLEAQESGSRCSPVALQRPRRQRGEIIGRRMQT